MLSVGRVDGKGDTSTIVYLKIGLPVWWKRRRKRRERKRRRRGTRKQENNKKKKGW